MDCEAIQIAALGRPLYPGMLYDCRSDSFIPGVTLWDRESLSKNLDKHYKPQTSFNVTATDSISEKSKMLDISSSLKASLLGGMVEFGGSAKYLNDRISSHHQSRVVMQYGQTVRFEQLTMTHLSKVTYPQVFDQKSATHVVTAVLYGAQAFFVFDSMDSVQKNKQQLEGNLKMMLQNIPKVGGKFEGELKLTDIEQKVARIFSCTFYGDFELQHNPTNYQEAVKMYHTLPGLLGDQGEKAVPVTVWLYPLLCLDSKAAQLVQEVRGRLVSRTESILEELEDAILSCKDIMAETSLNLFPNLLGKMKEFHSSLQQCKTLFKKRLSCMLPAVRGGGLEEEKLANMLETHQQSPFCTIELQRWLSVKQSEISILKLYTKQLQDVPTLCYPNQLEDIIFDPELDTIVCFVFTSLTYSEPYLSVLSLYLDSEMSQDTPSTEDRVTPWFNLPEISSNMKNNLKLFIKFAEANQHQNRMKFAALTIPDPDHPGASIRLYQNGQLVNSSYVPVSKPSPVEAIDVQSNCITLKLCGANADVEHYRVEYKEVSNEEGNAFQREETEQWTVIDTPRLQESWTLRSLQPDVAYLIRYRAVSAVGVSEASDDTEISTTPAPEIDRDSLLKYTCKLSVNDNSAYKKLMKDRDYLWWGSVIVYHRIGDISERSKHPERFTKVPQMLCGETLSGSCFYWEVEIQGPGVSIGVAYESIERTSSGNESTLGLNDKSWCLRIDAAYASAWHNNKGTCIKGTDRGEYEDVGVGVFLNWPAGILTFYRVSSDVLTHLYTFHTTFTEPLCPAFYISQVGNIKFIF